MPDSASSKTLFLDTNLQGFLANMNFLLLKDTDIFQSLPNLLRALSMYLFSFPFPCDILKAAASEKSSGKNTEVLLRCAFGREDEIRLIFLLPDQSIGRLLNRNK